MQFQKDIAEIDAELTPSRVKEIFDSAVANGFKPAAGERCFVLLFSSAAAMLRTVRGDCKDSVIAETWTYEQMKEAFGNNNATLKAFESIPTSLLIATAIHLPMRLVGLEHDQLFTMSITCLNPKKQTVTI